MRRGIAAIVAAALFTGPVAMAGPSAAKTAVATYKNCTALHKKYQGGVARPGARDHRKSGHAKYKPYVNAALYTANKRLDADHDGIACEQ